LIGIINIITYLTTKQVIKLINFNIRRRKVKKCYPGNTYRNFETKIRVTVIKVIMGSTNNRIDKSKNYTHNMAK
jgi:hypothetical protein